MFAVVDLETTGGSFRYEKIIEIAIVIFDGEKILDQFQTLVNPQRSIPPNITRLTGITNEMVKDAPKFFEVAKEVVEFTEGQVFVAHNVNFDYNFLRQEYQSLGFNFSRKKVCTVQLSRKLIPGRRSYSLGNLSKDLVIENDARHRAMGDAMATTELLKKLVKLDSSGIIHKAIIRNPVLSGLHDHLKKEDLEKIPQKRGVYFFYNDKDFLIYIGKSNNIRERILSHLNNQSPGKYQEMKASMSRIDHELVAGEITCLLYEAEQIIRNRPFFNRALKPREVRYHIKPFLGMNGVKGLEIVSGKDPGNALFSFRSQWSAREKIEALAEQYDFCPEYGPERVGLYSECTRSALGNCPGACTGGIEVDEYNKGIERLLEDSALDGGKWALVERDNFGISSSVLVENGNVVGLVLNHEDDGKKLKLSHDEVIWTSEHQNLRKILIQNLRGLDFKERKWELKAEEVPSQTQSSNSEVK